MPRVGALARLFILLSVTFVPACDAATDPAADVGPVPDDVADGVDTFVPGAVCGDGVAEAGEACDGFDLANQSCASLGLGDGIVTCNAQCMFDIALCVTATPPCGGACGPDEVCDDGVGVCVLACPPGTLACGGACAPCDDPSAATVGCAGDRCVATSCAEGHLPCGGHCAPCPSGAAGYGCEGDRCVVSTCGSDERLCDGACAECPEAELGHAVCTDAECTLVCDAGSHRCDETCRRDDDIFACGAACQRCPGVAYGNARCVEGECTFECREGFHRCGDACRRDDDPGACGDACVQCPVPEGGRALCDDGACAINCTAGFHECGDACLPDDSAASCGDRCAPCPGIPGGQGICVAAECAIACDPGRVMCGGRCLACGDNEVCGIDGECAPASCPSGEVACEGGCCTPTLTVPPIAAGLRYSHDVSTYGLASARDSGGRLVVVTLSNDLIVVRRERPPTWDETLVHVDQGHGDIDVLVEPDDTVLVFARVARQLTLFRVPVDGPTTNEPIGPVAVNDYADHAAARSADGTLHVVRAQFLGTMKEVNYSKRAPGGAWTHERLPGSVGEAVAIAVDAAGAPHLAWTLSGGWNYATQTDGAWTIELRGSRTPVDLDMAFDSAGNLQVILVHPDFGSHSSRWARKTSAGWADEPLKDFGWARALRLDGTTPHVAGTASSSPNLFHSVRDGAAWTPRNLSAGGSPIDADIELALGGTAELVYLRGESSWIADRLDIWTVAAGATTSRVVDAIPGVSGGRSDLALAPDGALHAVYTQAPSPASFVEHRANVVYLRLDAAREQRVTIADGDVTDVALALDAGGRPTIAWRAAGGVSVRRFDGATWGSPVTVAVPGNKTIALAVDRLGVAHLAYDAPGGLGYRTLGRDGALGPEALIEAGADASHADLAIDLNGQPVVVFRKAGNVPSLRYAARETDGTWRLETIDDGLELGNAVGRHGVVLVGPDGVVDVVYQDENAGDVKHARRNGNGWTRAYVATSGVAGDSLAAAFGADGTLHAVFGVDGIGTHAAWNGTRWTLTPIEGTEFASSDRPSGAMVVDARGRIIAGYRADANREHFSLLDL